MHSPSARRLACLLIASLFVLASCGSGEDSASATSSTSTSSTSSTTSASTTTEAETADHGATTEENVSVIQDEGPPDILTPEEIALGALDLSMLQLGVEDLETTGNCVMDRLESEGIEFTGEGTAEILALSACDENVISEWLPETNPALPADDWACTVESIGEWINELSIPDGEAFFSAPSPPAEFVEATADRCDASVEDITAALS